MSCREKRKDRKIFFNHKPFALFALFALFAANSPLHSNIYTVSHNGVNVFFSEIINNLCALRVLASLR
jgi:hypothetical protein